MITFAEREPFISNATFQPICRTLVPVWMIKDGAEYFIANLPIEGGDYSPDYQCREIECYKTQLIQTDGRYFKFHDHTGNNDPESMLASVAESGNTFVYPDELFFESSKGHYGAGFVDFRGNQREVSASFHYRIFDQEYVAKLRKQAQAIINRKGRM
jgi:hypothetical protein